MDSRVDPSLCLHHQIRTHNTYRRITHTYMHVHTYLEENRNGYTNSQYVSKNTAHTHLRTHNQRRTETENTSFYSKENGKLREMEVSVSKSQFKQNMNLSWIYLLWIKGRLVLLLPTISLTCIMHNHEIEQCTLLNSILKLQICDNFFILKVSFYALLLLVFLFDFSSVNYANFIIKLTINLWFIPSTSWGIGYHGS